MKVQGEIKRFRRKLFGGFNRNDVAEYITDVTRERDSNLEAARKAEEEQTRLREELSRMQAKLDAYEQLIAKLRKIAKNDSGTARRDSGSPPAPEPAPKKSIIIIKRRKTKKWS